MMQKIFINSIVLVSFLILTSAVFAQTTSFTFQGKLTDGAAAANGTYQFEFKLFDAASGGNQIGNAISDLPATVTNGIFAVNLDFGAQNFNGAARYLEIGVRMNGGNQPYAILNPRQPVTSTPYAIKSLNAEQAVTANNSLNLGGVPAAQYVVTTDPRMTDARDPLPGSGNYIQNTQNQQASSNFNVSGEGKAFKFTSVFLNATSEFQQGGARVMQFINNKSGFVGVFTGTNTTGSDNMFVGFEAGKATTTGSFNAFLGSESGKLNTTGFNNSFFGAYAGRGNTTGTNNAYFGTNTGLGSNGSFNSFFGSNAGFTNFSGSDNSFFGNASGQNNTSGSGNSFFGRSAGEKVAIAGNNAMFGAYAGENTTTGGNSYFGAFAGQKNTSGASNTFVGVSAGLENTGGSSNTFIGALSGPTVGANGNNNIAIGYNAKIAGNTSNAIAIGAGVQVLSSDTIKIGHSGAEVQLGNVTANSLSSSNNLQVSGTTSSSTVNTFALNVTGESVLKDVTVNGSFEAGSVYATSNGLFLGNLRGDYLGTKGFWNGGANPICYVQSGGYYNLSNCSSSRRYKDNIQPFTGGLSVVNRLRPVTFAWKSNGQKDVGFVAEEVNEIEPLLSTYNEQGQIEGVKYAQVTTALVNAVKEQQEQIEKQQEQIKEQQTQIEALKALICAVNLNAAACQPAKKGDLEK